MNPFTQALLQPESHLLSSLQEATGDAAQSSDLGEAARGSRWQVVATPRGELLVKRQDRVTCASP
ncbi:MAG: hypothetical protein K0Q72_4132 [Armatimonadetes bacterium]|jgi:hypothetical protein|nr:hypothetical protein [Armatimonadota bacterium]